jgi:hypothetical protein
MAHSRVDLWFAVLGMTFAGALFAWPVYRLVGKSAKHRWICVAGIAVLALVSAFVWAKPILLAMVAPLRLLPVLGNPVLLVAFPLGALLLRAPLPLWRRLLLATALCGVAFWAMVRPLVSPTPACRDQWQDDVCIQTQPSSCSAAAGATLLRHYGIETTEEDMAELCLTSDKGTTIQGLLRALSIKTKGTAYRPALRQLSLEELRSPGNLPAITNVVLTRKVDEEDSRYSQEWGWQIDVPHAVVVLSFPGDGRVLMADPSVGREHWLVKELGDLMTGECVILVERKRH